MKSPTVTCRPAMSSVSRDPLRPGLSSLLKRRQLRRVARDGIPFGTRGVVRSLRVLPSGLDMELSHAVDTAVAQHRPLVAVLPLPVPAAPMAMAAAATIAAIAASGKVQARTAVVSPRLAGRQMYDELLVNHEQLSALIPRTMVGESADGNTVVTAHGCAQLLELESLDALTGLVLDLNAVELDDLSRVLKHARHRSARRPLLLLAITASPLDPAVAMIRQANGLVYAVDQSALASHASATPVPGPGDGLSLVCGADDLTRAGDAPLELLDCGDSPMDEAVAALWDATVGLGKGNRLSPDVMWAGNLRWAWTVSSSFAQLATSAARADHHAPRGPWAPPSLVDAPQRARDLAVSENDSLWLHWAAAAEAAAAASTSERKAAAIARITSEVAAAGRHALVLARNRTGAAALRSALLENPDAPAEVHVASMRDFAASRVRVPEDTLVMVPGPVPRPYAGWLSVPPAGGMLMLTAGPRQVLRAARLAVDARQSLAQGRRNAMANGLVPTARPGPAEDRLATVTVGGVHMPFESSGGRWDDRTRRYLEARASSKSQPGPSGRQADEAGLWTPFSDDMLAELERIARRAPGTADQLLEGDSDGSTATAGGIIMTNSGTPVEVVPLGFRPLAGGAEFTLLQPPGEMLTRRDDLQVKSVAARSLRPGDLVALIDGQARQDLFGHVIDVLEESPEQALTVELARLWQQCVQRIPRSGLTYEEIRRRSGVSVQAKTIGTWARGQAECPLDPEDVRRLAGAFHDEDVLSRADAIATALRELWHLHQKAGRWLSARLAEASRVGLGDAAIRGSIRDQVLDPVLGLRASDLLGSIRLCQVTSVGTMCSAPSGATGIPLSPAEAATLCSPAAIVSGQPRGECRT